MGFRRTRVRPVGLVLTASIVQAFTPREILAKDASDAPASSAAESVDALRRELDAQRAKSAKQQETIRQQQQQLDEQQLQLDEQRKALDRMDRKLDEIAGGETESEAEAEAVEESEAAEFPSGEETPVDEESVTSVTRDRVADLNRESVRVGDFPGSFKIPGPLGISLGIGGFIKVEALYDTDAENSGADFLPATLGTRQSDDDGEFSIDATLTRLHLDGRVPTDWGDFRAYVEWDLNDGNDGDIGVKWRHAYGTWTTRYGTLLVGQAWSTLMDLKILPESLTEPTSSGLIFQRQPIIRWTQPLGSGFFFHLAAEDPNSDDVFADNPTADLLNTKYPDGVMGIEYVRADQGHLRLNGIVRYLEARRPISGRKSSDVGWGLALTGHLDVLERDRAMFSAIYGEGLGRYLLGIQAIAGARITDDDGLEVRENWGGMLAYEHHWMAHLRSTAMVGFAKASSRPGDPGDLFESSTYVSGNLMWGPLPYLALGIEYIYGRRENNDGSDLDNHRVGIGFQIF